MNDEIKHKINLEEIFEKTIFNDFATLFRFFLKSIFTSRYFYITFLIPLILTIVIGTQLSVESAFISVLSISITTLVILNYGFIHFTIKKSTFSYLFNQNYSMRSIIAAFFASIFIVVFLSIFALVFFTWIFYVNDILFVHGGLGSLNNDAYSRYMVFQPFSKDIGIDIYYITIAIIINFLICFLFQSFLNTRKQFFVFAMFYIFTAFIFGGDFSAMYKVDPTKNPSEMNNYLSIDGTYVCYPYVNDFNPGFIWWMSQCMPVYTINQIDYYVFSNAYLLPGTQFYALVQIEAMSKGIELGDSIPINIQYFSFYDAYWIYIIVAPYFWMLLLSFLGLYLMKKQERTFI